MPVALNLNDYLVICVLASLSLSFFLSGLLLDYYSFCLSPPFRWICNNDRAIRQKTPSLHLVSRCQKLSYNFLSFARVLWKHFDFHPSITDCTFEKIKKRRSVFICCSFVFERGITIMTSYSDQNLRKERESTPRCALHCASWSLPFAFHFRTLFTWCVFFFLCWDRLLWPMAYGIVCSSFRNNFRWPLGIESLFLSLVEYRRFFFFFANPKFLRKNLFYGFWRKKRRRKKCD